MARQSTAQERTRPRFDQKVVCSCTSSDPIDLIIQAALLPFIGYSPGYSTNAVSSKHRFSWVFLKGHTRNRVGTVKLRGLDPTETPAISFHYFDEGITANHGANSDLQALVEGFRFARSVAAQSL